MKTPHLFLTLLAFAGIGGPAFARPANNAAVARLGQTVVVGAYAVTPRAVLEDSRCPPVVTCVWAGQVRLSVRVVALRGRERYNGEMTSMRPLQLSRGALQLASVTPPNGRDGRHIPPAAYRFGFRFQAN